MPAFFKRMPMPNPEKPEPITATSNTSSGIFGAAFAAFGFDVVDAVGLEAEAVLLAATLGFAAALGFLAGFAVAVVDST